MTFQKKLDRIVKKNDSLVCVGLDSDFAKIPHHLKNKRDPVFKFNKEIINATKDLICCYKPDIAFYEAYGFEGQRSLKKTIDYIHSLELPVLLDAKKGSIGHTAELYAKNIFEFWNVDAVTINIFTGISGLLPFLAYKDRWSFAYIASSNLDGQEFQKAQLKSGEMLYEFMARKISALKQKNVGAIVPGTDPEIIRRVRNILPNHVFLIPGIGAQGGDLEGTVRAGLTDKKTGIIISSSRGIIFASSGKDFAEVARRETQSLRNEINKFR